ncbi:hypothetical protein EW026_g2496 [Hermanssonia centrifuga]|uniref:trans-L-3-hydroxyproline dehydratase n=1 Tax=Hermanssonia centrifuga TaxID=98765 RepID=A0A4S4KN31_9APHY|nr:hypothetical protein EW026_g2496 [Hermanssonia centrifuga]
MSDFRLHWKPTRIVLPGSFQLKGDTLLEKRAYAKEYCDHLRKRLMREPRGHAEMYGAILVQDTEETAAGCADIGVLFCHNEGYSTMCGHATIALGRFLIDAHDLSIFPRREQLKYDAEREETLLRLHAPCGVVQVRVPTLGSGQDARSDGTRRVSFKSVASFVSAIDVKVDIPESLRWTELKKAGRSFVTVDVSFGGAYYAIVSAEELGFERGIRAYPLSELSQATAVVKSLLRARKALFEHPSEEDLEYLYGVIIVEKLAQRKELEAAEDELADGFLPTTTPS